DEVEHRSHLVGRHARVAQHRTGAFALVRLRTRHLADLSRFTSCTIYLRAARSWPAWYRKVRVGANSPSLWPTIDSVMYTGTCLRPSWTAMVWPTMSGMIVERRDHVLMTRFSLRELRSSTFFNRWSSTNGPFFRLRGMAFPTSAHRACGGAGR